MTLRSCFLSTLCAMLAQVRSLRGTATRSAARWGTAIKAFHIRPMTICQSAGAGPPMRPGVS
eukprot:4359102-Lingulodinium_polyedra.AAC.1